jgi:hypothetical protein
MSAHTPGPWSAFHDHGWLVVQSECESLYLKIAKGSSTQKNMANARLIAAAPDLLIALRSMLAIVSETGIASGICCCGDDMDRHENPFNCGHVAVDSGHYHSGPFLESARAAISKATGETE